jgi:hypothetical protein
MTQTYEPGTVAELLIGSERVRAIVRDDEWLIVGHSYFKSIAVGNEALIDDVCPLVVLDLQSFDRVRVVEILREYAEGHGWGVLDNLADQIEAQTKAPRIPEPGLWGVVRDDLGYEWVRVGADHSSQWEWLRTDEGNRADFQTIRYPVLVRDGMEDGAR